MDFTVEKDNVDQVMKAIRELSRMTVVVGIPEENNGRNIIPGKKDAMNNASLGYIHEFGSPAQNIPARAWLVPGVEASKDKWTNYLEQAGKLAFEGKPASVEKAMDAAGDTAATSVKTRITAGIPPPLAPLTVAGRMRAHAGTKAGPSPLPAVFGGFTPLVDTSQMLNSVTHVVRKSK